MHVRVALCTAVVMICWLGAEAASAEIINTRLPARGDVAVRGSQVVFENFSGQDLNGDGDSWDFAHTYTTSTPTRS